MYDVEQTKELLENLDVQTSICTKSEKDLRQYLNIDLNKHAYCVEQENALNVLLKSCIEKKRGNSFEVNKDCIDKVYKLLKSDLFIKKKDELNNEHIYSSQVDELTFFKFVYDLYSDIEYRKSRNKDSDVSKEIAQNIVSILHHYAQLFVDKEDSKITKDSKLVQSSKDELLHKVLESIPYIEASIRLKFLYCKDVDFLVDSDIELLRKICSSKRNRPSKIQEKTQQYVDKFQTILDETKIAAKNDALRDRLLFFTGINIVCSTVLYQITGADARSLVAFALLNIGAAATSTASTSNTVPEKLINERYESKKHTAYQRIINYIHRNEDEFDQFKELLLSAKNQELLRDDLRRDIPNLSSQLNNLTSQLHQAKKEKNEELKHYYRTTFLEDYQHDFIQEIKSALSYFVKFDNQNKDKLEMYMRCSEDSALTVKMFVESNQNLNKKQSSIKTFEELLNRLSTNRAQEYLTEALLKAEKACKHQQDSKKLQAVVA